MHPSCQTRGRFAPSPSGRMHLGNAWTALLAWLSARSKGGAMILRMEDLDPDRSKDEFARLILEDMAWLGLDWDEGPDKGGPYGPYVQDLRRGFYQQCLDRLDSMGLLYPCYCTRAELRGAVAHIGGVQPGRPEPGAGANPAGPDEHPVPHHHVTQAPHAGESEPIYAGTCLLLTEDLRAAREGQGRRPSLRVRAGSHVVEFTDMVLGLQAQTVAEQCGDFVLRRADGVHAYQLAVSADDCAQRITEVVRGADLLESTARQLSLMRIFGWAEPAYAHVPLLVDPDGRRLSKRRGDVDLGSLRARGVAPQAIVGYLGFKAGLLDAPRPAAPHELVDGFSFAPLPAGPVVVETGWMEEIA